MSGCTTNSDSSGPATETTAAKAAKVDDIAATVPEDIKASGKLIVGTNPPYSPNEFKDPSGKIVGFDVDLMNAIALDPRADGGVPGVRFRQDHPGDPGRHLQRRHVVVHRHQGARTDRRLRHLLLGRLAVGPVQGVGLDPVRMPAARRLRCRPRRPQEVDELPAKSKACTDAGKPAIEILKFDGQDQATNAVVLGQADAMSADSPVTAYAIKQSDGKLEAGRRGLRFGAVRLAGQEGLALATSLQKALEHLIETGDYKTIATNWGVEAGTIDKPVINGATS